MAFKKNNKQSNKQTKKSQKVPKSIKKYVKKEIKKEEETKYFDKAVTVATNCDFAGSFFQILTAVTQGVSDTQRIGDKLRIRALEVRLSTAYNGANAIMRCIVFQYLQ